jgi:hypothetical protein
VRGILELIVMDNAFELFHERIIDAIRNGDVVCLFFPRLGKTLILDLRQKPDAPPAIFVEDTVRSPQERLDSLKRLRPEFPLPEELRLAPWFGFVSSIEETGIYGAMLDRCVETGYPPLSADCREAVEELIQYERRMMRAIVRGEMSRTIWQRSPQ